MVQKKCLLLLAVSGALLAASPPATAQDAGKIARVGWVTFGSDTSARPRPSALEGFRAGLRERGWIEGRNIVLDVRGGDRSNSAAIAKEFLGQKTDVIFTDGAMVNGLKAQAGTIPIVFTMSGDP